MRLSTVIKECDDDDDDDEKLSVEQYDRAVTNLENIESELITPRLYGADFRR